MSQKLDLPDDFAGQLDTLDKGLMELATSCHIIIAARTQRGELSYNDNPGPMGSIPFTVNHLNVLIQMANKSYELVGLLKAYKENLLSNKPGLTLVK